LHGGNLAGHRYVVIDRDKFQSENGRTQLLLTEGGCWLNKDKAPYVAMKVGEWGAEAIPVVEDIDWIWRRKAGYPHVALVGLHDLEGRRIVSAAGFNRLIESGVGTNLMRPRVTWHVLPGNPETGSRLFIDVPRIFESRRIEAAWVDDLLETPGGCGWVQFEGVSATAPCLGLAAAALALSELGVEETVRGAALLWSPCLPFSREILPLPKVAALNLAG
jgi:hypothetical protein